MNFEEHVLCTFTVPPGWLIQWNCEVQYVASYHEITDIISLFGCSSVTVLTLLRKCYTFVYRDVRFLHPLIGREPACLVAFGKISGIDCRRFHSLAVSLPSRAVLKTLFCLFTCLSSD